MSTYVFESFLQELGFQKLPSCSRYSPCGTTYAIDTDEITGYYWFYNTELFSVNIHDFTFLTDKIIEHSSAEDGFISLSYFKSVSGESLQPYMPIENRSLFTVFHKKDCMFRFLVHKNIPFLSVGLEFREEYWQSFLPKRYNIPSTQIINALDKVQHTEELSSIDAIATQILSHKGSAQSDAIFFEAKAQEFLSIVLDHYFLRQQEEALLSDDDIVSLDNVKSYIDDHYTTTIPLDLLAEIAWMSKSSLKSKFKQRYHMSTTEYLQRRRMQIADHLLMNSNIKISDVARAVGYQSSSRFSELYKRHKGITPLEYRKRIQLSMQQHKKRVD